MTKPDWCPADVWEAADILADELNCSEWPNSRYEVEKIARAILAERERALEEAAGVAETPRIAWSSSEYSGGFNDGCNTAAKLIRALKETP